MNWRLDLNAPKGFSVPSDEEFLSSALQRDPHWQKRALLHQEDVGSPANELAQCWPLKLRLGEPAGSEQAEDLSSSGFLPIRLLLGLQQAAGSGPRLSGSRRSHRPLSRGHRLRRDGYVSIDGALRCGDIRLLGPGRRQPSEERQLRTRSPLGLNYSSALGADGVLPSCWSLIGCRSGRLRPRWLHLAAGGRPWPLLL